MRSKALKRELHMKNFQYDVYTSKVLEDVGLLMTPISF